MQKMIAVLLVIFLAVTPINVTAAQAKEGKYIGDGFEVTFKVTSQWTDSFNADVTIKNIGNNIIDNWAISFLMPYEITQIWNGIVKSNEAGSYVIKNAVSNQDIAPGKSVGFGFTAKCNGAVHIPAVYEILSYEEVVSSDKYEINFLVTSDWKSAFNGEIRIKNISDKTIEDWKLQFDFDANIERFWTAEILEHTDNHYYIKNAGYNSNIKPGDTIVLGFSGKPGNVSIKPVNYQLSQIANNITEPIKEVTEEDLQGITWDQMQDTDQDGLPDEYEHEIGTDYLKPDSDGDGLPDGFEVLYACTNPLNPSTLGNGVTDDKLDSDEDGLTMKEEYLLSTDPLEADTDNDGLLDGEEVKIYNTLPLVYDTDGDGIGDGDEILLGLDPLNANTNGTPDSESETKQIIESDNLTLERINQNNDNYQLSLEINAKGSVNSGLFVRESAYTNIIDSISILGTVPEIIIEDTSKLDSMLIKFRIDQKNIYTEYSSTDLIGIKRYNIFMYDEELGFLLPVETQFDEANQTIYAEVNDAGTFCVMDLEKWFSSMELELTEFSSEEADMIKNQSIDVSPIIEAEINGDTISDQTMEESNQITDDRKINIDIVSEERVEDQEAEPELEKENHAASMSSDTPFSMVSMLPGFNTTIADNENYNKDVMDIVFLLNTAVQGLTSGDFSNIKYNINEIGKRAFYESKSVRIYIIDPDGNKLKTMFGQEYATNEWQLNSMIDKMLNNQPKVPYLNEQFDTLLNDVPFQTNSSRVAVVIGDAYINSYSMLFPQKLADANIYTCVVEPRTQVGSLYWNMATATNGILVYDFEDFTDDITKFLYGFIPDVPNKNFTILTSTGLKSITLRGDLDTKNGIDTDYDTLTDWQEVNQPYVTVASDGRVLLPTLSEYISRYGLRKPYLITAFARLGNTMTTRGISLNNAFDDIRILPVLSDPTSRDGDGDGILDKDEFKWDGKDTRYQGVDPLHKDTVETLFYKLTDPKGPNRSSYPSYLEINDNNVTLHVRVMFKDDASDEAVSAFQTTYSSTELENLSNSIINRLDSNFTFKDVIMDGIRSRWDGVYYGGDYDFYKGLKVNFSVNITEQTSKGWFEKTIEVNVKNGVCGVCNQSGTNWKTNCKRIITMYTSYCNNSKHKNKVNSDCTDYQNNLYTIAAYEGTTAHEFGHVFGLKDLYGAASVNNGYEPISQNEIRYNTSAFYLPRAEGMMKCNGRAISNDIEMVLIAFEENKWQYFVPAGSKQVISSVIKEPQKYTLNGNTSVLYVWDSKNKVFK